MDFDQFAGRYQAEVNRAARISVEKLAGEKARLILYVLSKWLGIPKRLRVLDIGCGIGAVDRELENEVGELYGTDVSLESLKFARANAPSTRFVHCDGSCLPFADASFDAVFAICVLHHVPPIARSAFIAEMLRPIRPGGAAILVEHNRYNPVTRRIVSRCAFDADAVLLSCREAAKLLVEGGAPVGGRRYVGFWPFRHGLVEHAERALGWLPMGAQYCIWGFKRS